MSSVSVVIPCYKYGDYLESCVRSVLDDQPGVDVRVLIIDDGSPDDSADKARAIAAREPRVEVWAHETNRGHVTSFNEGLLDWANGDYTVLISADDMLTPGALSRAVELLDANPNVGFCYGHPMHFQHPGPPPPARTVVKGHTIWDGHWWLRRRFKEAHGCVTSPEVVVRTTLQHKVGGYDPRLPAAGDGEMWMRLAAHADVGYLRGVDQAYYRRHVTQMSVTEHGQLIVDLEQNRAAFEVLLERCGPILPDADELDDMVHRKLARTALRRAGRAYDRGRTDTVPVEAYVAFAADCYPNFQSLPEFRSLKLRQKIGPEAMPYLQPLVLSAVAHKAGEWLWWQSWKRRGI